MPTDLHRFILASTFLLALASCGDSDPPAPATAPEKKSAKPSASERRAMTRIGSYQRSPFSDNVDVGGNPPSRALNSGESADATALASLLARATPNLPKDEAVGLITEARAYNSDKLVDLTKALMQHPDDDIRGYALTLVEGFDSPLVLPLVQNGLRDKNADVRLQSLEVLRYVKQDAAKAIYKQGIADSDPNVRMLAFSNALELSDDFKKEIVMENAASPVDDLARSSLAYIEADLNKSNLPTFIRGLGHSNPLIKDQVFERMYFLFDKKFTSVAEAQAWWKQNQALYNDDLIPLSLIQQDAPVQK